MTSERCAAALLFLALTGCTMPTATTNVPAPETIFAGGTVLAGPSQAPQPNWSVVVSNGMIVAVGPAESIRAAHPSAHLVDVHGTTVMPGLTDAHGHLYGLGLSLDTANVIGAPSYDDVIARVRDRAQRAAPGDWILGRGWDQNRWPDKQFPTAAPLDAAAADHPACIRLVDGHAGISHTPATHAQGRTAETAEPATDPPPRDPPAAPTRALAGARCAAA